MENEQKPLTLFEISSSVHNVCQCSLDIISSASSHQIQAAIDYNKQDINKLLVKLLTITFIQKNEQVIQIETKKLAEKGNTNNEHQKKLENYCNQKLLEISPIHGFSPKQYFLDYKISDDIRMEILTYLKPIQLFKSISLLNKRFSKNVETIHESPNDRYSKIFETKNFTFDSFLEMEEYCTNSRRKALHDGSVFVDWRSASGFWYFDSVTNIDNYGQRISVGKCSSPLNCSRVAPYQSMTFRHCSTNEFTNKIIKRGYLNETCDINISNCSFSSNGNLKFDLVRGFVGESEILNDLWICGKINFRMTLDNSIYRVGDQLSITITGDAIHNKVEYEKIYTKIKKSFKIFQIYVDIDITKYYEKYSKDEKTAVDTIAKVDFSNPSHDQRRVVTVIVHGDNASTLTYFGHKSSINERIEIISSGFCDRDVYVDGPKRKFLDLIDYPNYCLLAPSGRPVSRLKNEQEFNEWIDLFKQLGFTTSLMDCGVMKRPINKGMLKKIFYDEKKDELHVKSRCVGWTFVYKDSDAPAPLKNAYGQTFASKHRPRLIDVIITEPDIIDIGDELYRADINDIDDKKRNKKDIYFERLSKWKGFIKCTCDITDAFNEFQNRLKDEWIQSKRKINMIKTQNSTIIDDDHDDVLGNNRRYFTNFNGKDMPYLKWERRTNKIKHDYYLWSTSTVDYNYQLELSDLLADQQNIILPKIFFYTCTSDKEKLILERVCLQWQDILRNGNNTSIAQ